MKISQLSTDAGLDVLCEITPYIGAIISDEELTAELRRKINLGKDATQAEVYAAGLDRITKLMPIILKAHRADVYGIVGAINGKTEAEIAGQSVLKTAIEIRDIVKDKEFADFFKSLWEAERT